MHERLLPLSPPQPRGTSSKSCTRADLPPAGASAGLAAESSAQRVLGCGAAEGNLFAHSSLPPLAMPVHHLSHSATTPAAVRLSFPDGLGTRLRERPGQTGAGRGEGRTAQPGDERRAGKAGEEGEQDPSSGAAELSAAREMAAEANASVREGTHPCRCWWSG